MLTDSGVGNFGKSESEILPPSRKPRFKTPGGVNVDLLFRHKHSVEVAHWRAAICNSNTKLLFLSSRNTDGYCQTGLVSLPVLAVLYLDTLHTRKTGWGEEVNCIEEDFLPPPPQVKCYPVTVVWLRNHNNSLQLRG